MFVTFRRSAPSLGSSSDICYWTPCLYKDTEYLLSLMTVRHVCPTLTLLDMKQLLSFNDG